MSYTAVSHQRATERVWLQCWRPVMSSIFILRPGHDVTLQCQGPSDSPITVVKWSRSDLDSNPYIFYFRENRSDEDYQRPSHRGRVELRDPEMKNGDASVILKNVTVSDTGTYECVVSVRRNGNRKRNIDPFILHFLILIDINYNNGLILPNNLV
uniref:Ig-like domain-containing protein n=1 Tax=Dicentrarchus labrax TaxID=13489 RepID=A0A8P4G7A4_DICLA